MRRNMLRTSRAAFLSVVALLVVACSTAAPSASPTAAPTATPSPAPTTPAPTATAALSPVELLVSYVHADLRDTCEERDEIYDVELASITCGPDDLPFDYSLFASAADMDAAFDDDVDGAETPPQPDGECNQGNHLAPYDFDGRVGRVNCREHTSSSGAQYHVIEWTDEDLLVIGYISNRVDVHTWDELIDFWLNQAGPYAR